MTLNLPVGQDHNIPSGHRQSSSELKMKDMDRTRIFHMNIFSASDLDHSQITLGQGHDTPSSHKQSLW